MGKKLDALLGRRFKTSKFKVAANMAVSRLAVLKNQRQARCSIARSDVVEFLNNSNRDRAFLRVEQVIKEQNMLDVFVLVEGYCNLLMERVKLIEQEKNCPEELKEAISSLIFAATRCGEFPELQEIRAIFTSRFGKEFAARAIELRNNCGVNPKIIQKLSTRMPSLENKMKVLKDIASENSIHLPIEVEETVSCNAVDFVDNNYYNPKTKMLTNEDLEEAEALSDLVKMRSKYRDVADAAQAAFESAAYAAAAARAAVQLSRPDPTSPNSGPGKLTAVIDPTKGKPQSIEGPVPFKLRDIVFHGSDREDEKSEMITTVEDLDVDRTNTVGRDNKHFPLRCEVGFRTESSSSNSQAEREITERLSINRKPVSVRTRWARGR